MIPPLITRLEAIEKASGRKWYFSFVVNTDDPSADAALNPFFRYPWVRYGVAKDGELGPRNYGMDRNVDATVIVARNGTVLHKLVFPQDLFYSSPHILGVIASAMEVDHDTLRSFIGTDDYMSNPAFSPNMQRQDKGGPVSRAENPRRLNYVKK